MRRLLPRDQRVLLRELRDRVRAGDKLWSAARKLAESPAGRNSRPPLEVDSLTRLLVRHYFQPEPGAETTLRGLGYDVDKIIDECEHEILRKRKRDRKAVEGKAVEELAERLAFSAWGHHARDREPPQLLDWLGFGDTPSSPGIKLLIRQLCRETISALEAKPRKRQRARRRWDSVC